MSNIRLAVRLLAKSPGFTLVCVLTLALGIGANSLIFSLVNAVLLRALPFPRSSELVVITANNPKRGMRGRSMSVMAYEFYRDHAKSLSSIAGTANERFILTGGDQAEQLVGVRITHTLLTTLGVSPVVGRNFTSEEDTPGRGRVALISQGLWNRRFHGDPSAVGKSLTLDNDLYTVVGVMGAEFQYPSANVDVWVPDISSFSSFSQEQIRRGAGFVSLVARLRPGTTVQAASAELAILGRQYQREYSRMTDADPDAETRADLLQNSMVQTIQPALIVLSAAVGFVLLIACANVAALLLARAASRGREIAVRAALGASRRDIIGQLLTESLLLALISGALGMLVATQGLAPLAKFASDALPTNVTIDPDWRMLAFTFGISVATGVLFGMAPALQSATPDLQITLREGSRGSSGGIRTNRLRSLMVIGQVGLSTVLLVGSGLLFRSFLSLQAVDPGFDPNGVLTMQISLPASKYSTESQRAAFMQRTLEAIRSLPGVQNAGAVLTLPLGGRVFAPILPEGQPPVPFAQRMLTLWQSATPGYFEAMHIRLIKGRTIQESDRAGAPVAVVINESFARRLWPNENPLGKHLSIGRLELQSEVVGVVADVKTAGFDSEASIEAYTPYAQRTWPGMTLVVKSAQDAGSLANAVRSAVASVDRDEPVTAVQTLNEIVEQYFGQRRLTLILIGAFATLALLLALVGLHGIMAYSVTQRTRELGIRRALGASSEDIRSMVLGQALRLTGTGIVLGIAGSLALTRLISGLLYGVKATDPTVFAAAALLFTIVALAASYLPASRAAKVDPAVALRYE